MQYVVFYIIYSFVIFCCAFCGVLSFTTMLFVMYGNVVFCSVLDNAERNEAVWSIPRFLFGFRMDMMSCVIWKINKLKRFIFESLVFCLFWVCLWVRSFAWCVQATFCMFYVFCLFACLQNYVAGCFVWSMWVILHFWSSFLSSLLSCNV